MSERGMGAVVKGVDSHLGRQKCVSNDALVSAMPASRDPTEREGSAAVARTATCKVRDIPRRSKKVATVLYEKLVGAHSPPLPQHVDYMTIHYMLQWQPDV